MVETHCTN